MRRPAPASPSRCRPSRCSSFRSSVDAGRQLALEGDPHAAGQAGDGRRDRFRTSLTCSASSSETATSRTWLTATRRRSRVDGAVRRDGGEDRAAVPVLAELQWIGVAGVGVPLARRAAGGSGPGRRGRCRPPRSPPHRTARAAACPAPASRQAALRGVRQGQVHAAAIRPEVGEEAVRVGRRAVGRAPQREAVGQRQRREAGLREEVDVRRPLGQRVRAARRQPVVVAGREHDAAIRAREARAQEGDGVRREAVVLEQVAGAQDRVDALLHRPAARMRVSVSRRFARRRRAVSGRAQANGASRCRSAKAGAACRQA